jgi:hypothetical protein
MKKTAVIFGIMVGMLCSINMYAQKPAVVSSNDEGWQHIGQTTASFKTQNESIQVLGADEFSAIKLKVSEAPLNLERLQVFYESGEMEEIKVEQNISANEETRVIKLKHPDRDIKKVAFTYKSGANANGDKADVALYGLKSGQPAGKDSYTDEKAEVKEDAEEVKGEARETRDEVREEANEAADEVEKDAQSAGDKVTEGVNDAAAAIKDQKVKDKVGPGGETVYLDDNAKYYYVDNQGEKVYITKVQLKDKKD